VSSITTEIRRFDLRVEPRLAGIVLPVAVALVALALAGRGVFASNSSAHAASAFEVSIAKLPERQLLAGINRVRLAHGLGALAPAESLVRAADARARSMAHAGYFGHVSPDGTPFWRDILRYYPAQGFSRWTVGENLLWSVPDIAGGEVVGEWLASPEHRAILLERGWTQIGAEAIRAQNAPGLFRRRDVTIVVAEFGTRVR
jgi:uncharacterized protein YkwD